MFTVLSSCQCTATASVHQVHLTSTAQEQDDRQAAPTFGPGQSASASGSPELATTVQYYTHKPHLLLMAGLQNALLEQFP